MAQTLGQHLVNALLPEEHRTREQLGKSSLNKKLVAIAKKDPTAYVGIVTKLKQLGDELSTLEGVSVGLDDLMPVYPSRDKILQPAVDAVKRARTDEEREGIILRVQDAMLAHTKEHPGSMTAMALSGSRGNIPQLMKTVASPVAAVDARGRITPWLIGRSYSEGLSPADYWVAGNEARVNTVKSSTSVAEPGDVSKIFVNTLYPFIITREDCGTRNGIAFDATDNHVLGRFLGGDQGGHSHGTLVTPELVGDLRKHSKAIVARSPMTCEAPEGICQKCQGLDEKGHVHQIGVNVGVRAANALSEPLTQFALNAKHGVRLLKSRTPTLEGLPGLRQLLDIPSSFINKATLAEGTGRVTKIVPAPHGGAYVHVGDLEHYVAPHLPVLVHEGDHVEAGDRLSEGIPKPDELVHHKGLGAGREYLVKTLHELYRNANAGDIDKRHLELLARADLNHVRIVEPSGHHPDLLKGEVISYSQLKELAGLHTREVPVGQAEGNILGKEILHLTVGTPITSSMMKALEERGVKHVTVSVSAPRVEFLMKPITRTPLLNPDWLARLAHRYLKESLLKGAHQADVANLHGPHPIPAYAFGAEFGTGPEGRY